MPAKFEKEQRFDGFDAKTGYQMVPVGDRRQMEVVTGATDIVLRVSRPGVASLANFFSLKPFPIPSLTVDRIVLPANARVSFSILGVAVGHAELLLETTAGRNEALLLVSVKSRVDRTFALCLLSDIRRSSSFFPALVVSAMNRASQTFVQQTNLKLTSVGPPTAVEVMKDLGDPLKPEKAEVRAAIIDATPPALFLASLIIYCCWNIEGLHQPLVGLNFGQTCFVEDDGSGGASFSTVLTFAHEVGHGLGLDHNGDVGHMMFKSADARSSLLAQFEIDTVNPSGTLP